MPAGLYPRSLRVRLDLKATLALEGQRPQGAHVIDLSQRGAFVETELRAEAGAAVRVVLELPDQPLPLEAVVAREGTALREADHPDLDALVVRAPGLGLRFVSLRAEERKRLERYLRSDREG